MSIFTRYDAALSIQYHSQASVLLNRDYWVVTEPFVYKVNNKDSNLYVTVPTGFLTDGASVPRFLWSFAPPWSSYGQSAVLHDYLCEYGTISNGYSRIVIGRKCVDSIFLESMGVLGVNRFKRTILSAGVTIYRNVADPKNAVVDPLKREIEEQIMLGYVHTGDFTLTLAQVSNIRTKFKLN